MHRSLAAVTFSLSLVGCAAGPQGGIRTKTASAPAQSVRGGHTDATGVWDWSFRSQDNQGDERFEQEEWHLSQKGSRIEGYYLRVVDMRSLDDRLFRCNQKVAFMKVTRVRVAGQIEGNRVQLRETAFDAKPGPCDDGARNLVEYKGTLAGGNLSLRWGPEAGQTLIRRVDGGRTSLAELGAFSTDSSGVQRASHAPTAELGGTWEWELRSIDAEGDERLEREEWHLNETSDGIRGYYDRTVRRVRGDGTFTCNKQERYETATRYTVVGQRFGETLMLTEVEYKAEPSACDNALRRLDSYKGHVSDSDSLVLSWGPGNQLLRRKR
jgi:hypothetical protein